MQEQLCLALFLNTWYLAYLCGSVGFSKPALSCVILEGTAADGLPQQQMPGILAPSRCEELPRPEAV